MEFQGLRTLVRPDLTTLRLLPPVGAISCSSSCRNSSGVTSLKHFIQGVPTGSPRVLATRIGVVVTSRVRVSATMGTWTQVKEGVELRVFETVKQLGEDLAPYVAEISNSAVEARGAFSIVLSGGSLISTMGKLAEEPFLGKIDWSKWHVFWADERVVPLHHPDSNYKLALDGLLSKVSIPPANVHALNDKLSPQKAAEDYESVLKHLVEKKVLPLDAGGNYPRFDLILLGMGPDGHLASLFPNHPLVSKTDTWVASIEDSPKPPPERITLTLPVINAAENVAFVATGSGKADKLKLVFGGDLPFGEVPAKLVSPVNGKLVWFTDKDAVAKL
ncbi:hypothetical protein R1flu_023590 [Riccia fluitans]|uniref:6-phosphogluconolactonase n=1 Tax=Riccia fluitans TaxID=41844 RepID=A0ABD1XT98_9MARC